MCFHAIWKLGKIEIKVVFVVMIYTTTTAPEYRESKYLFIGFSPGSSSIDVSRVTAAVP